MDAGIKAVIERYITAYGPSKHGCVTYLTDGVSKVANKLDISYDAAKELVKSWIGESF